MITASQKKQLTSAGYTIKGDTVLNRDGKTVGGYNKNGNIFSGSSTVRDILKGKKEEAKPAAKKASTPTKKAPKEAPVSKDAAKGYKKGDVTTASLDKDTKMRGKARTAVGEKAREKRAAAPAKVAKPKDAKTGSKDRKTARDNKREKAEISPAAAAGGAAGSALAYRLGRGVGGKRTPPKSAPKAEGPKPKQITQRPIPYRPDSGLTVKSGRGGGAPLMRIPKPGGGGKLTARGDDLRPFNYNKGGMVRKR